MKVSLSEKEIVELIRQHLGQKLDRLLKAEEITIYQDTNENIVASIEIP